MKKNGFYKRIFILTFGFLFLTGCTADYNLQFTKDGKIYESITILESDQNIRKVNTNIDDYINNMISFIDTDNNIKEYKKTIVKENSLSGIKLEKTYPNIEDYFRFSKLYPLGYQSLKNEQDNNKLQISGNYFNGNKFFIKDINGTSTLDKLTVNVYSQYNVLEHNANSYDKGNPSVLKWDLSNSGSFTEINFALDTTKRAGMKFSLFNISPDNFLYVFYILVIAFILGFVFWSGKKNNQV